MLPFSLMDFLEDRGQFTNKHGVTLTLLQEESIHVSCRYPGVRQEVGQWLEIVCCYRDEGAALDALGAKTKIALNQVKPLWLLQEYEEGRMVLSCLVERERRAGMLLFRKDSKGIRAVDEDNAKSHLVTADLRFGEHYLAYTQLYFQLL